MDKSAFGETPRAEQRRDDLSTTKTPEGDDHSKTKMIHDHIGKELSKGAESTIFSALLQKCMEKQTAKVDETNGIVRRSRSSSEISDLIESLKDLPWGSIAYPRQGSMPCPRHSTQSSKAAKVPAEASMCCSVAPTGPAIAKGGTKERPDGTTNHAPQVKSTPKTTSADTKKPRSIASPPKTSTRATEANNGAFSDTTPPVGTMKCTSALPANATSGNPTSGPKQSHVPRPHNDAPPLVVLTSGIRTPETTPTSPYTKMRMPKSTKNPPRSTPPPVMSRGISISHAAVTPPSSSTKMRNIGANTLNSRRSAPAVVSLMASPHRMISTVTALATNSTQSSNTVRSGTPPHAKTTRGPGAPRTRLTQAGTPQSRSTTPPAKTLSSAIFAKTRLERPIDLVHNINRALKDFGCNRNRYILNKNKPPKPQQVARSLTVTAPLEKKDVKKHVRRHSVDQTATAPGLRTADAVEDKEDGCQAHSPSFLLENVLRSSLACSGTSPQLSNLSRSVFGPPRMIVSCDPRGSEVSYVHTFAPPSPVERVSSNTDGPCERRKAEANDAHSSTVDALDAARLSDLCVASPLHTTLVNEAACGSVVDTGEHVMTHLSEAVVCEECSPGETPSTRDDYLETTPSPADVVPIDDILRDDSLIAHDDQCRDVFVIDSAVISRHGNVRRTDFATPDKRETVDDYLPIEASVSNTSPNAHSNMPPHEAYPLTDASRLGLGAQDLGSGLPRDIAYSYDPTRDEAPAMAQTRVCDIAPPDPPINAVHFASPTFWSKVKRSAPHSVGGKIIRLTEVWPGKPCAREVKDTGLSGSPLLIPQGSSSGGAVQPSVCTVNRLDDMFSAATLDCVASRVSDSPIDPVVPSDVFSDVGVCKVSAQPSDTVSLMESPVHPPNVDPYTGGAAHSPNYVFRIEDPVLLLDDRNLHPSLHMECVATAAECRKFEGSDRDIQLDLEALENGAGVPPGIEDLESAACRLVERADFAATVYDGLSPLLTADPSPSKSSPADSEEQRLSTSATPCEANFSPALNSPLLAPEDLGLLRNSMPRQDCGWVFPNGRNGPDMAPSHQEGRTAGSTTLSSAPSVAETDKDAFNDMLSPRDPTEENAYPPSGPVVPSMFAIRMNSPGAAVSPTAAIRGCASPTVSFMLLSSPDVVENTSDTPSSTVTLTPEIPTCAPRSSPPSLDDTDDEGLFDDMPMLIDPPEERAGPPPGPVVTSLSALRRNSSGDGAGAASAIRGHRISALSFALSVLPAMRTNASTDRRRSDADLPESPAPLTDLAVGRGSPSQPPSAGPLVRDLTDSHVNGTSPPSHAGPNNTPAGVPAWTYNKLSHLRTATEHNAWRDEDPAWSPTQEWEAPLLFACATTGRAGSPFRVNIQQCSLETAKSPGPSEPSPVASSSSTPRQEGGLESIVDCSLPTDPTRMDCPTQEASQNLKNPVSVVCKHLAMTASREALCDGVRESAATPSHVPTGELEHPPETVSLTVEAPVFSTVPSGGIASTPSLLAPQQNSHKLIAEFPPAHRHEDDRTPQGDSAPPHALFSVDDLSEFATPSHYSPSPSLSFESPPFSFISTNSPTLHASTPVSPSMWPSYPPTPDLGGHVRQQRGSSTDQTASKELPFVSAIRDSGGNVLQPEAPSQMARQSPLAEPLTPPVSPRSFGELAQPTDLSEASSFHVSSEGVHPPVSPMQGNSLDLVGLPVPLDSNHGSPVVRRTHAGTLPLNPPSEGDFPKVCSPPGSANVGAALRRHSRRSSPFLLKARAPQVDADLLETRSPPIRPRKWSSQADEIQPDSHPLSPEPRLCATLGADSSTAALFPELREVPTSLDTNDEQAPTTHNASPVRDALPSPLPLGAEYHLQLGAGSGSPRVTLADASPAWSPLWSSVRSLDWNRPRDAIATTAPRRIPPSGEAISAAISSLPTHASPTRVVTKSSMLHNSAFISTLQQQALFLASQPSGDDNSVSPVREPLPEPLEMPAARRRKYFPAVREGVHQKKNWRHCPDTNKVANGMQARRASRYFPPAQQRGGISGGANRIAEVMDFQHVWPHAQIEGAEHLSAPQYRENPGRNSGTVGCSGEVRSRNRFAPKVIPQSEVHLEPQGDRTPPRISLPSWSLVPTVWGLQPHAHSIDGERASAAEQTYGADVAQDDQVTPHARVHPLVTRTLDQWRAGGAESPTPTCTESDPVVQPVKEDILKDVARNGEIVDETGLGRGAADRAVAVSPSRQSKVPVQEESGAACAMRVEANVGQDAANSAHKRRLVQSLSVSPIRLRLTQQGLLQGVGPVVTWNGDLSSTQARRVQVPLQQMTNVPIAGQHQQQPHQYQHSLSPTRIRPMVLPAKRGVDSNGVRSIGLQRVLHEHPQKVPGMQRASFGVAVQLHCANPVLARQVEVPMQHTTSRITGQSHESVSPARLPRPVQCAGAPMKQHTSSLQWLTSVGTANTENARFLLPPRPIPLTASFARTVPYATCAMWPRLRVQHIPQ
eukprot:GEMP01000178.1.p1 GENE.GEMP01000178.1~~GEMP01000178.1.p1  ORF type:complete len:2479 (+),score=461.70 GEMP01000178.1:263-7699(+)